MVADEVDGAGAGGGRAGRSVGGLPDQGKDVGSVVTDTVKESIWTWMALSPTPSTIQPWPPLPPASFLPGLAERSSKGSGVRHTWARIRGLIVTSSL